LIIITITITIAWLFNRANKLLLGQFQAVPWTE